MQVKAEGDLQLHRKAATTSLWLFHRSCIAQLVETMLGDEEDVFDSVTWETPSPQHYDGLTDNPTPSRGFRELAPDSQEDGKPNQPKWEGYLITSVKDPVKEMAETKDAYVSYLVSAKVLSCFIC